MNLQKAIEERHSVRQYEPRPVTESVRRELEGFLAQVNRESGLHLQVLWEEPECFTGMLAHYGSFRNVENYIAVVGSRQPDLEERCGYFGEKVVLAAQALGLNTCWVVLTYKKGACKAQVATGEKLVCVIALGYGKNAGKPHKSKPLERLCPDYMSGPAWYRRGVDAALLAPTARNQQKFRIFRQKDTAVITSLPGACTKLDLGIIRYHFDLASGTKSK